jgi:hypothetical protein
MSKKFSDYNNELEVKVSALREYLTDKANNVILGITYWRQHRHHKCYKCKKYGHIAQDCENVCLLCDNIHPKTICVQTYYKTLKKIAKIMKGISELNIRSKMEQIMTLEIANEQELLNIKYKYENLEPSKQSEIIIEKQPKQIKKYENLAPSITTPIEIKHKFNVLKGIIVKRLFIERTTSIFDVFKTKKNDSKMTLTEGRHIEFLMQNNCQRNNNRYTTWKRKENPKPKSVMYIDMPYVTSGKNTIILREKRELTCKSALIRQKKLDYLKDLMRRLEKQKKKASNELNKYNPRLFNKIKATIEQRKKEAEYLKKITNKELNKAKDMNYRLKEKINDKINRKIDRIEMNYKIKMQDIYDWQERLRQKQEKLDTKFNQANYLYREANKIVKLNKKEIEEGTNENKTPYELKMDRLQKASVKDWQKAHLKLDTQEKELETMHNIINQDEEEDEEEEDYNTPEFIENDD